MTTKKDTEVLIARVDKRNAMLRAEINQYLQDLKMWHTAHGTEYAARRVIEVQTKLDEIDKI